MWFSRWSRFEGGGQSGGRESRKYTNRGCNNLSVWFRIVIFLSLSLSLALCPRSGA
jgi:hypothetical protein